jgi:uncharacterized membrane protein
MKLSISLMPTSMPRTLIKNKNIKKSPRLVSFASRSNYNNSMKKDLIFPLIIGIIFGAMIMIFWQFTARINNQNERLAQLEQYTSQNSQTVNDVVSFINQNLNPQGSQTPDNEIDTPDL